MNEKTDRPGIDSLQILRFSWDNFHDEIRGFVIKRVSALSDAEDIIQEIFLRIHRGAARMKANGRIRAWVYAIARTTIADFYRARYLQQKRVHAFPNDYAAVPRPINLESYEGEHDVHEEVLSWLRPMIDQLPDKYRKALLLADIEGLRQQEVATRLGLSLSGAKTRIQRARAKLGERLQACCDIEFGQDGRAISYRKHRCAAVT